MLKQEKFVELSALRIFTVVADSETLTQAAEKLGITQSAVSQALKQLETQMNVELVVRRSRPLKLTASGRVMRRYARSLLEDHQRMHAAVGMASEQGLAKLRLGLIDSFADAAGQQILEQLMPFAEQLTLRTGLVGPLKEALLERDIDMLLTSDPMQDHPELEMLPILRDPFVALVAEKHLPQCGESVIQLAANLPFISYNRQLRLGGLTQLIARRLGIELPIRYELDSTTTLLRFVQNGHGWAFAPATCLMQNPMLLQGVRILPVEPGSHARYICLLARKGEFGDLPRQIARICRDIYSQQLVPQLPVAAPWLAEQAYPIEELPAL
ncbi:LysR family transcriptional regulator [Marinobacterium jannaschii]|uniref:LysR family transcriptional regulator n=1 Tax=Marinobacterium jannaschii TaxID=64970 RepID=UPI0006850A1D|nr:LysR family transcriptional regulator [Marinobacterium jannaschii]